MNIHLHSVSALAFTGLFGLGAGGGSTPPSEDPYSGLFKFSLADDVSAKIGGRLFYDWGWFDGDEATFNTDATGTTPELEDGTEFRAGRIHVEGELYQQVGFKAEFDFSQAGATEFKDVFMTLKDTAVGELKVGHFKEPFSLEQLTSARFITFMERGLTETFTPGRNSGFQILDQNEEKSMTWAAGVFRTTDNFAKNTGDGEYGYTARVTGTPLMAEDGAEFVHLGAAASFRTDGSVRFRSRPEAHLLNQPADSGTLVADETLLTGLEAAWVGGPLSVQSEYQMAAVSGGSGGPDADFSAYYFLVSYFLTGEHRNYKNTTGAFDRIKPSENFGTGSGAVELAARYSFLDLDDGPSTDEMTDATIGVNWYLNPNTRVMLDLVHSEFEDGTVDDDANLLLMRFQVDW
ncbi:MAG: porin [Planctomycetes bacterium]|nr:porin [Planctomycetota bacterium]